MTTTITNVRTFASAAEAAAYYVGQDILPVPVAYRGKNPKGNDWEKLRINAASVANHFNGTPQNIGALLAAKGSNGTNGTAKRIETLPDLAADRLDQLILSLPVADKTRLALA